MTTHYSFHRSLSSEKLDSKFTIRCKDDWWSDLLDDDLRQHFTRLKLNKTDDNQLSKESVNITNRIYSQKSLDETFNENTNDPALNDEINEFISEYEKELFNTSNEKYKSELNKQGENLKLNESLFQRKISLEIKSCQLAKKSNEPSDDQMKHLKEINTNCEGKENITEK